MDRRDDLVNLRVGRVLVELGLAERRFKRPMRLRLARADIVAANLTSAAVDPIAVLHVLQDFPWAGR